MKLNRINFFITIALCITILDQIVKHLVDRSLETNQNIYLIGTSLSITKVYNKGIAFGTWQQFGNLNLLLALTITVALIIYYIIYKEHTIAFALIIGGALGNIIDRMLHPSLGVVDYISVLHFPVFNIADTAITIGGLLIVLSMFKVDNKNKSALKKILEKKKIHISKKELKKLH